TATSRHRRRRDEQLRRRPVPRVALVRHAAAVPDAGLRPLVHLPGVHRQGERLAGGRPRDPVPGGAPARPDPAAPVPRPPADPGIGPAPPPSPPRTTRPAAPRA